MKRLLMVAFQFPPFAGSSGVQRTLRFVQHLPSFGWEPIVLSADPRAYEQTSDDLLSELPRDLVVERAFALDSARHLSWRGRHFAASARPDRWITWRWGGVRAGLALIRRHAPAALWSTYPIATAHVIGALLQQRSQLPWVADFRDPMAQDGYPSDPRTWQSYRRVEQQAIEQSSLSLFTTPGATRLYRARYPAQAGCIDLLENGYDEHSFAEIEGAPAAAGDGPLVPGCITLLHSGVVYPSERDPSALFEALGRLHRNGALGRLRLRFRAPVHDALIGSLAARHGVQQHVEVLPPIPYAQALREMLRADALLVLQAANCNEQIPAKLYEYLRARRPIAALTDAAGDTAAVLRQAGMASIASLASADEIADFLPRFVEAVTAGRAPLPDERAVAAASRRGRARALAERLDRLHDRRGSR